MAFAWAHYFSVALLFIIVTSPVLYKLTNTVTSPLGLKTADATGKASNVGVVIHSIVFVFLLDLVSKWVK